MTCITPSINVAVELFSQILWIAAPGIASPRLARSNQFRSHRIQVHVITHRFQVTRIGGVDAQRLASTAEQVTEKAMPPVIAAGVSSQEPPHARGQIGPRCLHDQIEMIAHQTERMDLPFGLRTDFAQRRQKKSAVLIVDKNSLPLIASIHHVINRSLKLDPKFPRHLDGLLMIYRTRQQSLPTPFWSRKAGVRGDH